MPPPNNKIPGFMNPVANGRAQADGRQLLAMYRQLGLNICSADNSREAGIYAVWIRLGTRRLKVFKSCLNWLNEFRTFGRDETGKIISEQKLTPHGSNALLDSFRTRALEDQTAPPKHSPIPRIGPSA